MSTNYETPDIEVEADRWIEEERLLAQLAELEAEETSVYPDGTEIADDTDPYAGISSCDALRIVDGIIPDPIAKVA